MRPPLLFAALTLVGSCSRAARIGRAPDPASPPDAVVAFGTGGGDEIVHPVRKAQRIPWSSAAVMPVPVTSSGRTLSARGATGGADRPLLLVLQSEAVGPRPSVVASLFEVARVVPDTTAGPIESVAPCTNNSWLAAFFLEGLGPRPSGPVVLEYVADGETRRMRIDPKLHTVRAAPALRLTGRDVDVESVRPERRSVSIRVSNTFGPAMSVLVWRTGQHWETAVGTNEDGTSGAFWSDYRNQDPIQEWRLYLFEAVPAC